MSITQWDKLESENPNLTIRQRLATCPHSYAVEQVLTLDKHRDKELIMIKYEYFGDRVSDLRKQRSPSKYDAMIMPDVVWHYNYLSCWNMAVSCMRERFQGAKPHHLQSMIDKLTSGTFDASNWTTINVDDPWAEKYGLKSFLTQAIYGYWWVEPLVPTNTKELRIDYVAVLSNNESGSGTVFLQRDHWRVRETTNDMEIWLAAIAPGDTPETNAIAKAFVYELTLMALEQELV